ncbi:MAG: hypothetical protein ACLR8P_16605 [Clostridium fessum]
MEQENKQEDRLKRLTIEGKKRRSGGVPFRQRPVDKLFVLDGCKDGPVMTITREARKTRIPSSTMWPRRDVWTSSLRPASIRA